MEWSFIFMVPTKSLKELGYVLSAPRRYPLMARGLVKLPKPEVFTAKTMVRFRVAVVATALEARYYPVLNPE